VTWAILGECGIRIVSRYLLSSVVSLVIPFLDRKAIPYASLRLKSYFLGFSPLFVILSIREEGLFYTNFALLVCNWADLEPKVADQKKILSKNGTRSLRFDDARLALTFLFLVQVAFFGTGK
jgi:phosphatidylinositol glycan class N